MRSALVYGFGSYFTISKLANDIDLLIIHSDITPESAKYAISVKKALQKEISSADVVILSKKEEQENDFVSISEANPLDQVNEGSFLEDIERIVQWIKSEKS